MDLSLPEHYAGLKKCLDERRADTVVLFLATSPHLFPQICEQLGKVGLNGPNVRVVLEKPLGHDLASALEINRAVRSAFTETQALRIDHYLGKSAVQNLMALRFGNALFEPLWRREASRTSRSAAEAWRGRAATSATHRRLRDADQNRVQLLTMVAIESRRAATTRSATKLKVLRR
jgi:glucose-6-phosphate 1-dehydrogenase